MGGLFCFYVWVATFKKGLQPLACGGRVCVCGVGWGGRVCGVGGGGGGYLWAVRIVSEY